jgi:formate dehydrogenase iron-sulfur subunit
MSKSFFVDLSKCTACRGCQVACKQWNKLPATETSNWGSHQNPKDLNFSTYKLVRFQEVTGPGILKWLFFPEQCRHCVDPPCKMVADGFNEGAVIHDEATGAVIYTELTKDIDVASPEELCPYNVPRQNPETKVWSKCTMCLDRVQNGMLPACVQTCPTGTMQFGDREEILEMAKARLAVVKKTRPKAELVNADSVRVIYLCEYPAAEYYSFVTADAGPSLLGRRQMFAKLLRPARVFG